MFVFLFNKINNEIYKLKEETYKMRDRDVVLTGTKMSEVDR